MAVVTPGAGTAPQSTAQRPNGQFGRPDPKWLWPIDACADTRSRHEIQRFVAHIRAEADRVQEGGLREAEITLDASKRTYDELMLMALVLEDRAAANAAD